MLEYLHLNLKLRKSVYPYRLIGTEFVCSCYSCYQAKRKPHLVGVIALSWSDCTCVALLRNGLQYTELCAPVLLSREKYLPVSAFCVPVDIRSYFRTNIWRSVPLVVLAQEYAPP